MIPSQHKGGRTRNASAARAGAPTCPNPAPPTPPGLYLPPRASNWRGRRSGGRGPRLRRPAHLLVEEEGDRGEDAAGPGGRERRPGRRPARLRRLRGRGPGGGSRHGNVVPDAGPNRQRTDPKTTEHRLSYEGLTPVMPRAPPSSTAVPMAPPSPMNPAFDAKVYQRYTTAAKQKVTAM